MSEVRTSRWLLLLHQLPADSAYLRVKVWRKLAAIGAVGIKFGVYVLPNRDGTREDFQWIAQEVAASGGDASICAATLVEGLSDHQVIAQFQAAREKDYRQLADDASAAATLLGGRRREAIARLRRRLGEVVEIDFFSAPGRDGAEAAIASLEGAPATTEAPGALDPTAYVGRTWVTRAGVFVDRIASAWLIAAFIDPNAEFRFVKPEQKPRRDELAFDMADGAFTHVGDRCTFEVLVERFGLDDPGLRQVAEVIHDIDCKDRKFGRPETAGVAALMTGLAAREPDDRARIERGGALLGDLLDWFGRRGGRIDKQTRTSRSSAKTRRRSRGSGSR